MSWRVVVISKRSKLDYKLGSLVVRSGEEEKRIFLDDISVLMCETTAISITAYLILELTTRKIKLIFCDNQHNPISELIPMHSHYASSGKIRQQISWDSEIKADIWQEIIRQKILNQAKNLERAGMVEKADRLKIFASEVLPGDTTNREGHAAKVYFNALYGMEFYRDSTDIRNSILNYGYSIILACFNREIAASGFLTNLGLWHDNASNPFNLGSDLMESFRPVIDWIAYMNESSVFDKDAKIRVLDLLNMKVGIAGSEQYLNNAIGIYTRSIFNAIEERNVKLIQNWYEL